MIFSLVKAEGHSMEPKIKNGSFFIASSIPYLLKNPKINEIIIFRNNEKIIVKKIEKIIGDEIITLGINKNDSKEFPQIKKKDILGKVIWIF